LRVRLASRSQNQRVSLKLPSNVAKQAQVRREKAQQGTVQALKAHISGHKHS
jgi:hypothetical protein